MDDDCSSSGSMYVVVYGREVGTFAGRLGARPHLVPLAAPH